MNRVDASERIQLAYSDFAHERRRQPTVAIEAVMGMSAQLRTLQQVFEETSRQIRRMEELGRRRRGR